MDTIDESGCQRHTVIHRTPEDTPSSGGFQYETTVFVTESGAIGMEAHGRIAIKTIESWIAMAWYDNIPPVPVPLKVDRS